MIGLVATIVGVVAILGLVFVLPIAGIVDARRHSDEAWQLSGQSRGTWIGLMGCAPVFFVPPLSLAGIVATALYWTSRRRLVISPPAPVAPVRRRVVI